MPYGHGADVMKHLIGTIADFPVGSRRVIDVQSSSIGIFNISGRLYAVRNLCPHHGAPLCEGSFSGTMMPSEPGEYSYGMDEQVIRCPWHGWEFDVTSGESLFGVDRRSAITYGVEVDEKSDVYVEMKRQRP